jgi:23S rRNA pseudouridine2605 synthase
MRLARYIALCGVASRREAERIVASGRVWVGSEVVTDPAFDVNDGSDVRVDGRPIVPEKHEYYVLNKPRGVVSTARDPQGRPKVTDLVESDARLYPVGRLDADTTGLVLLTNDGELANRLTHPSFEIEKAYRARVRGTVGRRALRALRSGIELEDGRTAPAKARLIEARDATSVVEIVIHEGRKRQVRRMCEAVGHPVIELERTRLGPLKLGRLASGSWRKVRPGEIDWLKQV